MPVLKNPRWERFAQELAKGQTADEAYQLAGYSENRGNAIRLKANESVLSRLVELQERAANRAEVSVERFTKDLLRIAQKAEEKDAASGFSVAKGAIMDAAKLNGLIRERVEHTGADGGPIETKDVSARELVERRIAGLAARGGAPEHIGKPH